ncbi:uncharacterized protein KY384_007483 [Bacidia gigantensis]|uniref:uncharacterized protein n=1 Tax=Bacidia gigantensis TaxID=2732470 RepID=UPI001D05BA85|nr:uncharacterized protein KY384_007483 [Bacidia gigantensis]KAG8527331.1 hypothetical protein KY384_007483 [Bacidia gigantensis]
MVGRRVDSDSFLKSSAEECVKRLTNLRQRAERSLSSDLAVSKSKRNLLDGVINDVKDSLRRLQAWITEFTKADQTQDANLLTNATTLFESLSTAIDHAITNLEARLSHRRMKIKGFVLHKRYDLEDNLSKSLKNVSNIIGDLQSVLPLVREASNKQTDRDARKSRVFQQTSKTNNVFAQGFQEIDPIETEDVQARALQMLWKHIPRLEDLEDKAGNPNDQGDGLYYDQTHIATARSILVDFHDAWCGTDALEAYPPSEGIKEVARICLTLAGMQQEFLLGDFISSGKTDQNLPFKKEQLETILQGKNADYADTFYTEQIRVSPKDWPDGGHAEFEAAEPLPYIFLQGPIMRGAYGTVVKVKDLVSGETYVRKQQVIPPGEQQVNEAWEHLERESERLRRLKHRHVVQLVKSYRRGRAFGLIMKPAASGDLRIFLDRFQADKFYSQAGSRDSVWLRPYFLQAFGCLAYGLEYIHDCKIRHKDIKPANILFQNATQIPARFLWADFGLAYDFSETGDSKTISTNLYSPRYAPPEVVSNWRRAKSNKERKSSVLPSVEEVIDEGQVKMKAKFDRSLTSDDEIEAHGRAADIFALGCVFLELLSRLIKSDLPLDVTAQFADNIDNLCTWASSQKNLEKAKDLCPLFNIAAGMIRRKPEDRFQIRQVVKAVMKADKAFSCELCRREYDKHRSSRTVPNSTSIATSVALPQGPAFALPPSPVESISWVKRVNSAMSNGAISPGASRRRSIFSVTNPTTPE